MKTILATFVATSFLVGIAGPASAETYREKNRYQESRQDRDRGIRKSYGYRAWSKFSKRFSEQREFRRSHNDRDGR